MPARTILLFPKGQIAIALLLFAFGGPLVIGTVKQASLITPLLLFLIVIVGLMLCRITQVRLNDPALRILGYFWIIKLALTLFLLYAGWIPQLEPTSTHAWGYDPQRYYLEAQELIDNNWLPDFVSLNYVGILYYYGFFFFVLGHNPVIPALINTFVTLIGTLYLIQVGYEIKGRRDPHDWLLGFALLLPEVLWFDVMTARETLVAALVLFALLPIGRYVAGIARFSYSGMLVVATSVLAIAAVRTSMLLPVGVSIILMTLLVKSRRVGSLAWRIGITGAAAAVLLIAPVITEYLGGYAFDVLDVLRLATSATENIALGADYEWSENSIGMLLMPEGLLQSILFLPLRMVLYLAAPLPNVLVPVSELAAGSWIAWQSLFVLLSSTINLFLTPYALASLVQAIKARSTNAAPLVFHISYWITFMAIAGGNLIIHERYRVMSALLLWACAWLGMTTCSKRLVLTTAVIWYALLTFGALFYIAYKFVLS